MTAPGTFVYLQQEDVVACGGLDYAATLDDVEKALAMHFQGSAQELRCPILHWGDPSGQRVTMHAGYLGSDLDVAGFKWTPANPANPMERGLPRSASLLVLSDPETAMPLAVMDGTLISAMRTGASSGVAARYFARTDSKVAGLCGAGVINRTQLTAITHVLPGLDEIRLFDPIASRAEAFSSWARDTLSLEIRTVRSAEAAIREADVVLAATTVPYGAGYVEDAWLAEGVFFAMPSENDASEEAVLGADRVVVDSRDTLSEEGFLIPEMCRRGELDPEHVDEMGAVIVGEVEGRRSPSERVIYSPAGMGILDVASATRVYRNAVARQIGLRLKLWDEPQWV